MFLFAGKHIGLDWIEFPHPDNHGEQWTSDANTILRLNVSVLLSRFWGILLTLSIEWLFVWMLKKPGCTLYKSLLLWLHCVHHIRLVTTYSPRELSGSGRIVKIAIRYIPSTRYESGSGLPGISQFHSPKFLDEYILGLQYSIWCNVELPQLR